MQWISTRIIQSKALTPNILQILLQPNEYIPYYPGQYLKLRTTQETLYFSIANAPSSHHQYELHIRHDPQKTSSENFIQFLKNHQEVEIQLPFGQADISHLDKSKPIIFIAGGIGFTPIKAIIEDLIVQKDSRIFECYWGAREVIDLYWKKPLEAYQLTHPNFTHLSLPTGKESFQLLEQVFSHHPTDLSHFQFLISGTFDMVFQFRDRLISHGISKNSIFSDAFEFE